MRAFHLSPTAHLLAVLALWVAFVSYPTQLSKMQHALNTTGHEVENTRTN